MAQDLPENPTSWWKKPAVRNEAAPWARHRRQNKENNFIKGPAWQVVSLSGLFTGSWVTQRHHWETHGSCGDDSEADPGTLLGNCRQLDRPEELFSPAVPKACITMGCTLWILDVAGTSWDLRVIYEPGNLVCFPSFSKPPSRSRAKTGHFITDETAPGQRNDKTGQISDRQEPGG